ncbi:hypothetical protein FRB94_006521 [Tulasnella sp. JGI-2019a]|nr:hypothetical protein FRB94_006521 [Tulasnella sp. JGI-2019a]
MSSSTSSRRPLGARPPPKKTSSTRLSTSEHAYQTAKISQESIMSIQSRSQEQESEPIPAEQNSSDRALPEDREAPAPNHNIPRSAFESSGLGLGTRMPEPSGRNRRAAQSVSEGSAHSNPDNEAFQQQLTKSPESMSPVSSSQPPLPPPSVSAFSRPTYRTASQDTSRSRASLAGKPRRDPSPASARTFSTVTTSPPPTQVPPSQRWATIRKAIGTGSGSISSLASVTSPPPPIPPLPSTSTTTSSQGRFHPPPPVPASPAATSVTTKTPKLSRFGFKHVVEQATDRMGYSSTRFEDELRRACWSARYGDPSNSSDREAVITNTAATLPSTTASGSSKGGIRRPPSVMSLASNGLPGNGAQGTVRAIGLVLLQYAPLTTAATGPSRAKLPLESEILSTLLGVFLHSGRGKRMEEEQWTAVETFDMISKTWRSPSAEAELERWLWCTKVAMSTTSQAIRPQVLSILSSLVPPSSETSNTNSRSLFTIRYPSILQAFVYSLATLRRSLSSSPNEDRVVVAIISSIFRGDCVDLAPTKLTEEYGVPTSAADEEGGRQADIRRAIMVDGVLRCMQVGDEGARRWGLNHIEGYWPPEPIIPLGLDRPLTALEIQVHLRKITTFARSSLLLTRPAKELNDPLASRSDSQMVLTLIQTRILPELEVIIDGLPPSEPFFLKAVEETRRSVARLVLDALCLGGAKVVQQVGDLLGFWWVDSGPKGWKDILEQEVADNVTGADWSYSIRMINAFVKDVKYELRQALIALLLPLLFQRLVEDPPPVPHLELSSLLTRLAGSFGLLFHKPLFDCARSSKEATIVVQLRILSSISTWYPAMWWTNDEMISVALMKRMDSKTINSPSLEMTWAKPWLGQCSIMMELISRFRQLTAEKKEPDAPPDPSKKPIMNFMDGLESRLAIMIEAREKSCLLPFSHRLLLTSLLLEMRVFTRSTRVPPWLGCIISWSNQSVVGCIIPTTPHENRLLVDEQVLEEVSVTLEKVGQVIRDSSIQKGPAGQRQKNIRVSTLVMPGTARTSTFDLLSSTIVAMVPSSLSAATLKLLVLVAILVGQEDYERLSGILWVLLDDIDQGVIGSACFLIMQCAEKSPGLLISKIKAELLHQDLDTRLRAIHRISVIISWRFQILTQDFIPDRARRRPFRMTRRPIAFVASDVGSSTYTPPERTEEAKLQIGASLPPELRKRVLELGWETSERDESSGATKWAHAPISLLPMNELEALGSSHGQANRTRSGDDTSGDEGSNTALLRRKSSASSYVAGIKKKALVVPQLLTLFSIVAQIISTSDMAVSGAARDLILALMRDDPALLSRPILEDISDSLTDTAQAFTSAQNLLHAHAVLPPALAHHVFNHLAGFLKTAQRLTGADSDSAFALSLPIMAQLAPQVGDLSFRELRRNKLDNIILPTFVPKHSTFAPSDSNQPIPMDTVYSAIVRTAQTTILLELLRQSPKDVNVVRKNYAQIPSLTASLTPQRIPALSDFLPTKSWAIRSTREQELSQLTSCTDRSYLLLCTQIFRCLNRHLSDRAELAKYMDGIGVILLSRGDDIGIVSHALIAYMTASTRFRRLFSTESGFSLFMPALLKVYTEAGAQPPIKRAIEYGAYRFYALHKEAFVFQALEAASQLIHQPHISEADQQWVAVNIYELIATLSRTASLHDPDVAGIHGSNKLQEQEAIITMVNEKPELMLPRTTSRTQDDFVNLTALGSDLGEGSRFPLDDFVRLFLTIIAHSPFTLRAQHFLKLLRLLASDFYNASSSARNVLREGMMALGHAIFERPQARTKTIDSEQLSSEAQPNESAVEDGYAYKPSSPSDVGALRREYLLLVSAYMEAGGNLERWALNRSLQLVKESLRDASQTIATSKFLDVCSRSVLPKEGGVNMGNGVQVLKELAPIFRAYASLIDFTNVLDNIRQLSQDSACANDREAVKSIVADWCGPALEACHMITSENVLLSASMRRSLVALVASSIGLPGADVMAYIERLPPTSAFLAEVILPLCLHLQSIEEATTARQVQEVWQQEAYQKAWVRLLAYAMSVSDSSIRGSGISDPSNQKAAPSGDSMLERSKSMAMALQIVKVVVIRAEGDVSRELVGVWHRVASFIRSTLREGNAAFALGTSNPGLSPPASPSYFAPHSMSKSQAERTSSYDTIGVGGSTRLVDYLLWSFLELICLRRSPLIPQLKVWMQEKMHHLEQQIRSNVMFSPMTAFNGGLSPATRPTVRDSRRVSTMFARPRLRGTGRQTIVGSPEGSPLLAAASGGNLSRSPSLLSLGPGLNSGMADSPLIGTTGRYNRFPDASPTLGPTDNAPRIIHLGPRKSGEGLGFGTLPGLGRTNSGSRLIEENDADQIKEALRTTMVSSPKLVQASHRRVRVIQSYMGYDPLPLNDNDEYAENDARAWTRGRALKLVIEETRDVLEEFRVQS